MQSSSHIKTELSKKDKKGKNMDTLSRIPGKIKGMLTPSKSKEDRPSSSVTQIGQPEVIVITVTEFR